MKNVLCSEGSGKKQEYKYQKRFHLLGGCENDGGFKNFDDDMKMEWEQPNVKRKKRLKQAAFCFRLKRIIGFAIKTFNGKGLGGVAVFCVPSRPEPKPNKDNMMMTNSEAQFYASRRNRC